MFDMHGGTAYVTVYTSVIGPDHTIQLNRIEKVLGEILANQITEEKLDDLNTELDKNNASADAVIKENESTK